MNAAAGSPTDLKPIGISALAMVLTTLIGASILTVVVADDTNAGGSIWFYPLLATIPLAISSALSGGTILAVSGLFRGRSKMLFGTGFGLVSVFLILTLGFWVLAGNWLFSTAIVTLPEVNREAEDIFFRSWVELEPSVITGAVFIAIGLSATMMRSSTKYWMPIMCIATFLAIWELGMLVFG